MYYFINSKDTTKKLIDKTENIIKQVQLMIKEHFTFSYSLIGSGSNRMITYNEAKHIDLDYNLVIQKDKHDLLRDPKTIRSIFADAFKKASGNDVTIKNRKNVFTCYFNKTINGFKTSMDVAVMVEGNDNYLYKICYNFNNGAYIWNKVKGSKNIQQKIYLLRHNGLWNEVRDDYVHLKNIDEDNDSYLLLLQAINNIITKYQLVVNG